MYIQKTGEWTHDWEHKGWGYAGRGEGKNNPAMQSVKGVGPLPVGLYEACEPEDHPVVGKYAIRLIPHPDNEMYGRANFYIHGDSYSDPGNASHGCIVLPPKLRHDFWDSDDHQVRVVSGVSA